MGNLHFWLQNLSFWWISNPLFKRTQRWVSGSASCDGKNPRNIHPPKDERLLNPKSWRFGWKMWFFRNSFWEAFFSFQPLVFGGGKAQIGSTSLSLTQVVLEKKIFESTFSVRWLMLSGAWTFFGWWWTKSRGFDFFF